MSCITMISKFDTSLQLINNEKATTPSHAMSKKTSDDEVYRKK